MVFGETTCLLVYSIGRWVLKNKKGYTVINHLLYCLFNFPSLRVSYNSV